jgi:predicted ATPase
MLADDLGVDPGPALQALERRLLAQDPSLLLPARPATPSRPPVPAPTVTRPLSTFVGRAAELTTLAATEPSTRLLTLVGPGGAGKTRLAFEHATAHPHGDGPWLARLADVTDPDLLTSAVAAAIGVHQPADPGRAGLTAAVADREALLILDNCEHLVAAVADLVVELLTSCPRLRVLATSREPLGVDGERLLPVAPLPPADAVALLIDRIGAVRPGWRPDADDHVQLGRLAEALDGIPLALELAAARARVLGLGELVALLGERFPALGRVPRGALAPHATLEAAVAWSVDLLPAGDRALLLRLWPFEGGFTMAAAAAVGSDLEALSSLVTRSVVAADTTVAPTRYRLLGIIRAYCREHDPDPGASRAAHAAWVRALVARSAPELRGERSVHAIRVLNREVPNLRAALAHDLVADPAAALRTAGLLEWFWYRGGYVDEGLRLLAAALAGAPDAPAVDRAHALATCGILRFIAGDTDGAAEFLWQGKALLTAPDSPDGWRLLSQVLYYEALLWTAYGDHATAVVRARESIAVSLQIGEKWATPAGEMALGGALIGLGDIAEGRRVLELAAAHAGVVKQNWIAAMSELLLARAWLLPADPDPAAALRVVGAALARFREEDDVGSVLSCLHTGAYAITLSGDPARGATLLAAVRRHGSRRGLRPDVTDPATVAALGESLEQALDPATRAAAEAEGAALDEAAMIAMLPAGQDQQHARR